MADQNLDVVIALSAPGSDEVARDILKVSKAALELAVSEETASAAAEEAAGHLDRYRRRLGELTAQRARYARGMQEGRALSKEEADGVDHIDAQIRNLEASMTVMSTKREAALAIVQRQNAAAAQEAAALAAVAQEQVKAGAAGVESAQAQVDAISKLVTEEGIASDADKRRAREAAITAGAVIRQSEAQSKAARKLELIEAAREQTRMRLAAAQESRDGEAIAAAIAQGKALEEAYKIGLQALQPYERAALRLEKLQRTNIEGAAAEALILESVGDQIRQLENQARRAEANRNRSLSMLFDETQAAIERSTRPSIVAATAMGRLTDVFKNMPGPVGAAMRAQEEATRAGEAAVKEARAEVTALEKLLEKLRAHSEALEEDIGNIRGEIKALEALTDRTEDQDAALEALRKEEAAQVQTLAHLQKGTLNASKAQEMASVASQRGAVSVGALVGVYAALLTGLAAIGGALLAAGMQTAKLAIETEAAGKRAGVTAEEMSKYALVLKSLSTGGVVVEMRDLSEMMTELSSKLGDAQQEGSPLALTLKAIGVEARTLQGVSPAKTFDTIVEALAKVPDEATRTRSAMALLGDDLALKVLPIIRQGPGALDALKQSAQDLGLTLSGDAVQSALQYRDAVMRLTAMWDGFVQSIGEKVVPILADVGDRLTGMAQTVKLLWIAMNDGVDAANKYGASVEKMAAQQEKARAQLGASTEEQKAAAKAYADAVAQKEKADKEKADKDAARKDKERRDAEQAAEMARARAAAYSAAQMELSRLLEGESEELAITRKAEDAIKALNVQRKDGLISAQQFAAARVVIEQRAQVEIETLRRSAREAEAADAQEALSRLEAFGKAQLAGVDAALTAVDDAQAKATADARGAYADAFLAGVDASTELQAALTRIEAEGQQARAKIRDDAARDARDVLAEIWQGGMSETERAMIEADARQQAMLDKLTAAYRAAYASIDATAADSEAQRAGLTAEYGAAQVAIVERFAEERQRMEEQALATLAQTVQGYVSDGLTTVGNLASTIMAGITAAAQETAESLAEIEAKSAAASSEAGKQQYAERIARLRREQAEIRKNALITFRVQQALQIAQAGMAAALAVIQTLTSTGGATNPLNIAGAVFAGAAGVAAIAQIANQEPPKFHRGGVVEYGPAKRGLASDERLVNTRVGEAWLSPQGVAAAGGSAGVNRLNSGVMSATVNTALTIGPREALAIRNYSQGRWSSGG